MSFIFFESGLFVYYRTKIRMLKQFSDQWLLVSNLPAWLPSLFQQISAQAFRRRIVKTNAAAPIASVVVPGSGTVTSMIGKPEFTPMFRLLLVEKFPVVSVGVFTLRKNAKFGELPNGFDPISGAAWEPPPNTPLFTFALLTQTPPSKTS